MGIQGTSKDSEILKRGKATMFNEETIESAPRVPNLVKIKKVGTIQPHNLYIQDFTFKLIPVLRTTKIRSYEKIYSSFFRH